MNGIEFNFVGKYNNGTLESGIPFTYKGIEYKRLNGNIYRNLYLLIEE